MPSLSELNERVLVKRSVSLMKYIWLLIMKTGNNSGLNRKEDVILICKGSLKVGILGLILESHSQQEPRLLSFNSPNLWLFFIKVTSSPIQQLTLRLSYPHSSRKQEEVGH